MEQLERIFYQIQDLIRCISSNIPAVNILDWLDSSNKVGPFGRLEPLNEESHGPSLKIFQGKSELSIPNRCDEQKLLIRLILRF